MNYPPNLVAKIRAQAHVLVRHVPPLERSDVFYLLRIAAIHELVDLWTPPGGDTDGSLVDRAQEEWEGLLLDAVPVLFVESLPPELLKMMDDAKAAGTDADPAFLWVLREKQEEWLDGVREDIRQLVDCPGRRSDGDSDRARALSEAHHWLLAQVPGYRRMSATDKELRNVRDALEQAGRLDKHNTDENQAIGLTLTWIDLHRKASYDLPFLFKGKDGQWRTTKERVRDVLRKSGATDDPLASPPRDLWPEKRGKAKGRTLSLDRRDDERGGSGLGNALSSGDDQEQEAAEALRCLRELLDSRLDGHPQLREATAMVMERADRTELLIAAAETLPVLVDLLASYRDERDFQAALVYEWGRGGHGKPKGWGAEEVAAAYGVSVNVVYKRAENARKLLVERGLRPAG